MPVWDVGLVRPRDQFGYWREVICEAFVPLAPAPTGDRREFASRVEVRPLGGLNCALISSRPQRTAHGPAEVARTDGAYYFVNLQLAGSCSVRQGGREDVVEPGQFTVVDTTRTYYFDFPRDWRMVSFRVPHAQLSARIPDHAPRLGAAVDATRGPGRVVSGLMQSLWELGAAGGSTPGSGLWEQSFAAAAAATLCGEVAEGDVAGADLRRMIEHHVQANLQDPDLSVRAVATRFGISPRSLHKLFDGAERSFAAMVRRARLDRCAELLADPSCSCPVAEVGARYGFGDPASFGRAFRREFGATPGEVRRSHRLPS